MTIAFTCPHCGHRTDVAERFAGQSGPCSACGQPITVPTLATCSHAPPPRRRAPLLSLAAVMLFCASVLLCFGLLKFFGPVSPISLDSIRREQCRSNLEQIATAISLYETDYGFFPPAYTTDAEGNRLHSWRTLLLPYLGEETLYESLDLDQPWDSKTNRLWHDAPVDVYQCPADPSGSSTDTNYVMILGKDGVSSGAEARKAVEVTDGVSQTILLVETAGSGIHWMQPQDLRWDETDFAINGKGAISSEHEGGAHVVLCDGLVEFLTEDMTPVEVRAMATRSGGEPLPEFADMIEEDFSP